MQDKLSNAETVIELFAKSLDEPLSADEQTIVAQAMEESPALRIVADGLLEFDALLKRVGMAIPDEGFPARVLLRIEAYERTRTRRQWYLTLGLISLGLLAALVWLALNWSALIQLSLGILAGLLILVPLILLFALATLRFLGQAPLLGLALIALILTLVWARASGGFRTDVKPH
ncbi:MAG: hypothetical protein HDKAJFGB_03891 [Anaerolineae bacterium]|nr:hypothetical protein [Anaerolineae bacterium]RIK26401.1 MAG: hypothetical protein DCC52_10305 [Chloroflexota bacterium]